MKPYSDGHIDENRWGRSTRRCPDCLSSSYFTASVGTISIYAFTVPGAPSPGATPCHGCAWNNEISCGIFVLMSDTLQEALTKPLRRERRYEFSPAFQLRDQVVT